MIILQMEPSQRLGYGENGTQNIKDHKWFADIDWVKLYNKEIEPQFKPHLDHEFDTRYFDEEVTAEDPYLPNFASKLEEELDDHQFDDFSFEEPIYITPKTTKRPRASMVTKLMVTNSGVTVGRKTNNSQSHENQPLNISFNESIIPTTPEEEIQIQNNLTKPISQDAENLPNTNDYQTLGKYSITLQNLAPLCSDY